MKRILLQSIRHYKSSQTLTLPISKSTFPNPKFFSSQNPISNPNPQNPKHSTETEIEDVSTKDLKDMINKYYEAEDEEMVPDLLEAILRRKFLKTHEDSDDELLEEIKLKKKTVEDDVSDQDFDQGLDDTLEKLDSESDSSDED